MAEFVRGQPLSPVVREMPSMRRTERQPDCGAIEEGSSSDVEGSTEKKNHRASIRRALWLVALVGAATGCLPKMRFATRPSQTEVRPTTTMAAIVVVQPSWDTLAVNILDGQGKLLGQLNRQSQTSFNVPAGRLRLYAIIANMIDSGDRIDGEVLPGRTYYATVSYGVFNRLRFQALKPQSNDNRWANREEYLRKTPRLELDPELARRVGEDLSPASELMAGIDRYVSGYDEAHRFERTLAPSDSLEAAGSSEPAAP